MPNTIVRNMMLVLLTMTSGCVDAISFLALGQVFTAAMTGNTVLFGLAVVHSGKLSVIGYAVALLGFIMGAAIASMLLRRYQKTTGWNSVVTISLCIEWVALILFAVVINVSPEATLTVPRTALLIAFLSFAMGIQSVSARRIGVTGVTTTVITSTLTGLVESIVWKLESSLSAQSKSGNQDKSVPVKPVNKTSIASIVMWISVIVFYGIGAGICGAIEIRFQLQAIWLPIIIVMAVILTTSAARVFVMERKAGMSM